MALECEWRSQQGTLTGDNRDCFGIAQRDGVTLYIVADGSTSSPGGGTLARKLVQQISTAFPLMEHSPSDESLIALLRQQHADLRCDHATDSASYLMAVHVTESQLLVLHAGDCRLGRVNRDQSINWLTPAHTLANAVQSLTEDELASHPDRHYLTRSFRGRHFQAPAIGRFSLYAQDHLIIATDGYWADLPPDMQNAFEAGGPLPEDYSGDDVSILVLKK